MTLRAASKGALGTSGAVFLRTLQYMEETLDDWFTNVEINAAGFSIPSCPFLLFYDKYFPGIDNGEWPSAIIDREGFSPLLDMMNGYLWRVWCCLLYTSDAADE